MSRGKQTRKKKEIVIMACVLAAVLLVSGVVVWRFGNRTYAAPANQAVFCVNGKMTQEYKVKNTDEPLGSDANPLTILEIVPNITLAEFGYMIPGCEPADWEKVKNNETAYSQMKSHLSREDSEIVSFTEQKDVLFADQIPSGIGAKVYCDEYALHNDQNNPEDAKIPEDATIYTDTNGLSKRNIYWLNGEQDQYGYYKKTAQGNGLFDLSGENFVLNKQKKGSYNWVQTTQEEAQGHETNYQEDEVWKIRHDRVYEMQHYEITNHDWLIQQAYNVSSAEFTSRVITVAGEDLNSALDVIADADMIYIHGAHSGGGVCDVWKQNCAKLDLDLGDINKLPQEFKDADMTWEAVKAIINRMASNHPAGLILDQPHLTDYGKNTNAYKLYQMILQFGPKMAKTLLLDGGLVQDDVWGSDNTNFSDKATGSYKGKKVWDQGTFYENDSEMRQYIRNPYVPSGKYDIWDRIGCFNGDETIWQYYHAKTDPSEDGFHDSHVVKEYEGGIAGGQNTEIFDYFENKNGTRPEYVNGNDIIEYILQGNSEENRKHKLRILEIEPCDTFIYKNDKDYPNWKLYYMSLFDWINGTGTEENGYIDWDNDIQVTCMASYEWNGDITDINSEYDMILFGATQNGANGKNGYNRSDLKAEGSNVGKLYTASGDYVTTDGKENLHYTGNDITKKKLREVESFLRAGKPVVVDGLYYTIGGGQGSQPNYTWVQRINDYVENGTNLYKLLTFGQDAAKSTFFVRGALNYIALEKALALEQCKIEFAVDSNGKEMRPEDYSGEDESTGKIGSVNYVSGALSYTFQIKGPANAKYKVRLYADSNSDGVYQGSLKEKEELESEAKSVSRNEDIGSNKDGTLINANEQVTVTRNLDETFKGILPWKLEVNQVKDGVEQTALRSSVIGYSVVKGDKTEIHVLQMNLAKSMDQDLKGARGVLNFADNDLFDEYAGNVARGVASKLPDYDIYVTFKKNREWLKAYGDENLRKGVDLSDCSDIADAGADGNTAEERDAARLKAWENELSQYDMLILGFMDVCQYTDSDIYQTALKDFIAKGKSIIISHDLVKDEWFTNNGDVRTKNDMELRDICGQRVKDWTWSSANAYSSGTQKIAETEQRDNDTRVIWHGWNGDTNSKLDRVNKEEPEGGPLDLMTSFLGSYETNYVGIANHSQLTEYPYNIPDCIPVATTHGQNYQLDLEQRGGGEQTGADAGLDWTYTDEAQKEQSDVVVWFNLTDRHSQRYSSQIQEYVQQSQAGNLEASVSGLSDDYVDYGQNWNDKYGLANLKKNGWNNLQSGTGKNDGLYSSREGDSASNYYIYNTGNITYTGVGHHAGVTVAEMKLFINTIIASYRAHPDKPTIDIPQGHHVNDYYTLYVTTDDQVDDVDKKYQVQIKVKDNSIVDANKTYLLGIEEGRDSGKTIEGPLLETAGWRPIGSMAVGDDSDYTPDPNIEANENIQLVGVQEPEKTTDTNDGGKQKWIVRKNGSYFFEIPFEDIKANGSMEYTINLKSSYTDVNTNTQVNADKTIYLQILQLGLFDLK